jgi:hypothetical protein
MDVKSTRSGKVFYQIDSQIAALLIEALPTVFEKVTALPPEKKTGSLTFNFDRALTTGEPCIKFRCDACSQGGYVVNPYPQGRPVDEGRRSVYRSAAQCAEEAARAFFFWHCGKKEIIPEALIEQFRKAFEG